MNKSFVSLANMTHTWIKHILWHHSDHFSWSVPTVVGGHLQDVSSKTENHKGFFVIIALRCTDFFLTKLPVQVTKFQIEDVAVLFAKPNKCRAVCWKSVDFVVLPVPVQNVDCVTNGHLQSDLSSAEAPDGRFLNIYGQEAFTVKAARKRPLRKRVQSE